MDMKEIKPDKLTSGQQNPYPKDTGDNFMDEKDAPPVNQEPASQEHAEEAPERKKPADQKKQEKAREAWEKVNKGKVISADERKTQEMLIEKGVSPATGGAPEAIDSTDFTDPIILEAINVVNDYSEAGLSVDDALKEAIRIIHGAKVDLDQKKIFLQRSAELKKSIEAKPAGDAGETNRERQGKEAKEFLDGLAAEEDQVSFNNIVGGITDPGIIGQIVKAKDVFKTNPKDKAEELRKIIKNIQQLDRTPTEPEDAQTKKDRDNIFKADKETVMGRLNNLSEMVKKYVRVLEHKEYEENYGREGMFGERKLSLVEKEMIRNAKNMGDIENLFNRIFDRVDRKQNYEFNSQEAFGQGGTYEFDEFIRVLNYEIGKQNRESNGTRVKELEAIVFQATSERKAREIIHNAYYAVIGGQDTEAMKNFIAQFVSGYADLAFRKAGVTAAMHNYEQALLMVREMNNGYLASSAVIGNLGENGAGEVNDLAEELLKTANEKGEILDKDGKPQHLEPWEINRALSFARGMSVINGRSIEIAATSILPGTELGPSAFTDLFAQKIIGELYPFRHSGLKFQMPKEAKAIRVLAYLMDRGKTPWTPKEIQDFDKMELWEQIKVLNDLMPEGQERFFSVLNPLEIGGVHSNTGWRVAGDPHYPGESAVKEMLKNPNERGWIGTGTIIERERGKLGKLKSRDKDERDEGKAAREKIKQALEKTARVSPLRLLLSVREFKKKVLLDLFKRDDYFSDEEKKIIQANINKAIREREVIQVEKVKEQKPEEGEGIALKIEKEMETVQKDLTDDAKASIKFAEIMKSSRLSQDMKELVRLQELAIAQKDESLVFNQSKLGRIIHDQFSEQKTNAAGEKSESFLEAYLRKLEHKRWKFPFITGTDDLPYHKYSFESTGERSFARRWGDMADGAKAGAALMKFIEGIDVFTEPGQIVEAMHAIYTPMKEYSLEAANRFMEELAEGVMKFYGKSWVHRLPLGIGTAISTVTNLPWVSTEANRASYAQIAYGSMKMAWDELDLNEFTRKLRDKGLIQESGQQKIQRKAGGGKETIAGSYLRTILPLIALAMAYYIATHAIKDEKS